MVPQGAAHFNSRATRGCVTRAYLVLCRPPGFRGEDQANRMVSAVALPRGGVNRATNTASGRKGRGLEAAIAVCTAQEIRVQLQPQLDRCTGEHLHQAKQQSGHEGTCSNAAYKQF